MESVIRGEPAAVLFLLERGADPDARAEGGMTALMYAADAGDTLMIEVLILNGADIELGPVEDTPPLMVAVLKEQFQAAHVLLKRGANPDARDEYSGTCLIYAAATNQYDMADLLLFFGADPSLKNSGGNDALLTAVQASNLECSDVLLQNGISPDSSRTSSRETPLMLAARGADTAMVALLLDKGANTELVDKRNFTPLAHAIQAGSLETVRLLAADGAYLHYAISPTRNLYDLAVMENQRKIAEWMKESGASPTPRPDFSEVHLSWGNSFSSREHMMQGRIRWSDQKFGLFLESGFDIRPLPQVVQVPVSNNLLHQYRENRWAIVLGVGKDLISKLDLGEVEVGVYFAVHAMLSGASYRGINEHPPMRFKTIPSAGLLLQGNLAGIKIGVEYYNFGTLLEKRWKTNISLYLKLPYKYGI